MRERLIQVTEWPLNLNMPVSDVTDVGHFLAPTGSLNSSQAARPLAGSLFTENVDVQDIIFKFKGKEICCDEDWDVIVKAFKVAREADRRVRAAIRVFLVDVGKRQ